MQMMGRSTFKEERRHVCWPRLSEFATFQSGRYAKLCATSLLNIRKCAASHHFRHLSASLPTASLAQNYPSSRISCSRYQLRRGACGQHSGSHPPTHPCYKSSASILNQQEATSTIPGSSLCDMSMEGDLQEAIIFDSAKIKEEFWIRRRELVGI